MSDPRARVRQPSTHWGKVEAANGVHNSSLGAVMSNESELLQLATPAAQALLRAMLMDGWAAFKDRFASIFAPGRNSVEMVKADLEESRSAVVADPGNENLLAVTQAEWRGRAYQLLLDEPGVANTIKSLIEEISPSDGSKTYSRIDQLHQEARVTDHGVNFQQGAGTQQNIRNEQ